MRDLGRLRAALLAFGRPLRLAPLRLHKRLGHQRDERLEVRVRLDLARVGPAATPKSGRASTCRHAGGE